MRAALIAIVSFVLAGCAAAPDVPGSLVLGPFVGVLPCADCPGISTRLALTRRGQFVAEGSYRLEETYLDRGVSRVTTGEWTTLRGDAQDDDAVVYQLEPDHPERSRYFVKLDERRIRLLDRELRLIRSSANLTLRRKP